VQVEFNELERFLEGVCVMVSWWVLDGDGGVKEVMERVLGLTALTTTESLSMSEDKYVSGDVCSLGVSIPTTWNKCC
jgi:hypothetical protein